MNLLDGYHTNRLWLDTATATIIDWSLHPDARTIHRINWSPQIDHNSSKWMNYRTFL